MKAYKIFNNDWTCNNFQFEIGKTYTHDGGIELCSSGFHACKKLQDCFKYYDCAPWNKIAEVELIGEILGKDGNKQVTNKIKIIREVPFDNIGKIIREGVAESKGVARSEGILNCKGIADSLFCDNINNSYFIFNKKITKEKYFKIKTNLKNLTCNWSPTYNNLKSLYIKAGKSWKKTPITNAIEIQKKEAWKDMPTKAIDYIKSLPEFDAKIFENITGIK